MDRKKYKFPSRSISIHALREEGDDDMGIPTKVSKDISIHALREEGDLVQHSHRFCECRLFLSTPSARRATAWASFTVTAQCVFLSTPSARRATYPLGSILIALMMYFYPRPPRGGRPVHGKHVRRRAFKFLSTPSARRATHRLAVSATPYNDFYPRPPRGGRPVQSLPPLCRGSVFLSTPSARRATQPLLCHGAR